MNISKGYPYLEYAFEIIKILTLTYELFMNILSFTKSQTDYKKAL